MTEPFEAVEKHYARYLGARAQALEEQRPQLEIHQVDFKARRLGAFGSMPPKFSGAPICAGEASPLRVATGGNANWSSQSVAAARPPAQIDGAIACWGVRLAFRSDNGPDILRAQCPFKTEQLQAFVEIRIQSNGQAKTPALPLNQTE